MLNIKLWKLYSSESVLKGKTNCYKTFVITYKRQSESYINLRLHYMIFFLLLFYAFDETNEHIYYIKFQVVRLNVFKLSLFSMRNFFGVKGFWCIPVYFLRLNVLRMLLIRSKINFKSV